MPPKKFLKPKPKGKMKPPEPETENDFLEAADEFEQAAGKWRAGDTAKAVRFFNRAIDAYNEGLKRHPQSFDLAYNK
jgi:ABC-type glycerol-3-phosphate transport system substrate-binding protein